MQPRQQESGNVIFHDQQVAAIDDRQELLRGLSLTQKVVNPKYFYDPQGSELFDAITRLPEYYPSRTEKSILADCRHEIAKLCGDDCVLIEPGSGSSEKVRLLLDATQPSCYVPIDISASFLLDSAIALGREFPWLLIHAVCADFNLRWRLPSDIPDGKRVLFYPGSTIGNLEPARAVALLRQLAETMLDDGGILIGVDLHKDSQILEAAYNDREGITAQFNLNVLNHLNKVLGADFDTDNFQHLAFYDRQLQRIEMHLLARSDHAVIAGEQIIEFREGETIHTENSYKYTPDGFAQLADRAGLMVQHSWYDEAQLFGVHYLQHK